MLAEPSNGMKVRIGEAVSYLPCETWKISSQFAWIPASSPFPNGNGIRRSAAANSSLLAAATSQGPSIHARSVIVEVRSLTRASARVTPLISMFSLSSCEPSRDTSCRSSSGSGASSSATSANGTSTRSTTDRSPSAIRTSTGIADAPWPRVTDTYTASESGCTASPRIRTSPRATPSSDATRLSRCGTPTREDAPRAASWTSIAKIVAVALSATNKIPSGPNVIAPAEASAGVPISSPYLLTTNTSASKPRASKLPTAEYKCSPCRAVLRRAAGSGVHVTDGDAGPSGRLRQGAVQQLQIAHRQLSRGGEFTVWQDVGDVRE